MIMSIRVYVNNFLTIQNSISQTQQDIIRVQSETDFIRNFELPYLQTDLAQRNLMHHQQMTQEGGRIVFIQRQIPGITDSPTQPTTPNILQHKWWANFIKYQWRMSIGKPA